MNFWKIIFAPIIGMNLAHFEPQSYLWCKLPLKDAAFFFVFFASPGHCSSRSQILLITLWDAALHSLSFSSSLSQLLILHFYDILIEKVKSNLIFFLMGVCIININLAQNYTNTFQLWVHKLIFKKSSAYWKSHIFSVFDYSQLLLFTLPHACLHSLRCRSLLPQLQLFLLWVAAPH